MESSNAFPFRSIAAALVAPVLAALACCGSASAQDPKPAKPTQTPTSERSADRDQWQTGHGGISTDRPSDERALFQAFAKIEGLSADYTEEKHLSLLAVPLKSKGKLHYLRPGFLSRIVTAPEKSKLTITENELRMAGKDGTEVIDLRQSDRVRLFVTSLVQVFRGDREALKKHYRVRYTHKLENSTDWQLELKPLKKPLDQIMKSLVLRGTGKAVTRIERHEPNGDRTITKIVKVDAKRTFSKQEKKELFGITVEKSVESGLKQKAGAPK